MRTTKPARILAVGLVVIGLGPIVLGVGVAGADSRGRSAPNRQTRVGVQKQVGRHPHVHRVGPFHHRHHLTAVQRTCLVQRGVTLPVHRPHHHGKLDAAARAALHDALVACGVIPGEVAPTDGGTTTTSTSTATPPDQGPVVAN